jgi:hypothetical protein
MGVPNSVGVLNFRQYGANGLLRTAVRQKFLPFGEKALPRLLQ